mmetsp:Transcript_24572/g.68971  ORF Transcript_24572/g.68971 Transcript_24572/m.68971 type:complete len:300 (+) Transcript_24572:1120-2019(+)
MMIWKASTHFWMKFQASSFSAYFSQRLCTTCITRGRTTSTRFMLALIWRSSTTISASWRTCTPLMRSHECSMTHPTTSICTGIPDATSCTMPRKAKSSASESTRLRPCCILTCPSTLHPSVRSRGSFFRPNRLRRQMKQQVSSRNNRRSDPSSKRRSRPCTRNTDGICFCTCSTWQTFPTRPKRATSQYGGPIAACKNSSSKATRRPNWVWPFRHYATARRPKSRNRRSDFCNSSSSRRLLFWARRFRRLGQGFRQSSNAICSFGKTRRTSRRGSREKIYAGKSLQTCVHGQTKLDSSQ